MDTFSRGFARYFLIRSRNLGFHPIVWKNMRCSSSACWTRAQDLFLSPYSVLSFPILFLSHTWSTPGLFCSLLSPSLHQLGGWLIMVVDWNSWCWRCNTFLVFYSGLVQARPHWLSNRQQLEYMRCTPSACLLVCLSPERLLFHDPWDLSVRQTKAQQMFEMGKW